MNYVHKSVNIIEITYIYSLSVYTFLFQSISCRQDLEPNPVNRYPFGAIDAKATSMSLQRAHRVPAYAQSARLSERDRHPAFLARMGPTHTDKMISPHAASNKGNKNEVKDNKDENKQGINEQPVSVFGKKDELPPFCWAAFEHSTNRRDKHFSHVAHPKCFDFGWESFP